MEHNSNNSSAKLPQITSPVQNEQIQSEININHKALTLIKKARKQVEDDAKMLANRIALLKQEEIKTMKKIEETRNKAIEIYHLKLKNEEKHLKVLLKQKLYLNIFFSASKR